MFLITYSTYMCIFSEIDVSLTSLETIWHPEDTLGGIAKVHCFEAKSVFILYPLSVIILSQNSNKSRNEEFLTNQNIYVCVMLVITP